MGARSIRTWLGTRCATEHAYDSALTSRFSCVDRARAGWMYRSYLLHYLPICDRYFTVAPSPRSRRAPVSLTCCPGREPLAGRAFALTCLAPVRLESGDEGDEDGSGGQAQQAFLACQACTGTRLLVVRSYGWKIGIWKPGRRTRKVCSRRNMHGAPDRDADFGRRATPPVVNIPNGSSLLLDAFGIFFIFSIIFYNFAKTTTHSIKFIKTSFLLPLKWR